MELGAREVGTVAFQVEEVVSENGGGWDVLCLAFGVVGRHRRRRRDLAASCPCPCRYGSRLAHAGSLVSRRPSRTASMSGACLGRRRNRIGVIGACHICRPRSPRRAASVGDHPSRLCASVHGLGRAGYHEQESAREDEKGKDHGHVAAYSLASRLGGGHRTLTSPCQRVRGLDPGRAHAPWPYRCVAQSHGPYSRAHPQTGGLHR